MGFSSWKEKKDIKAQINKDITKLGGKEMESITHRYVVYLDMKNRMSEKHVKGIINNDVNIFYINGKGTLIVKR